MIYLILGLILFVYIIRKSNTNDLIKEANITTKEQKKELNEKTIKIKSTKLSCLFLIICLFSIITIPLIKYTSIELFFLNYFGTGIYKEQIYIPFTWYALPAFILIIRGIIIQVNIGDYVKQNYNLTEIEVDIKKEIKNILIKKPKKEEIEILEETPPIERLDENE